MPRLLCRKPETLSELRGQAARLSTMVLVESYEPWQLLDILLDDEQGDWGYLGYLLNKGTDHFRFQFALEAFCLVYDKELPYPKYLETKGWKSRAERAKKAAGHRCQVCNGDKKLQAHHRTYQRRGRERREDVTVLCSDCHSIFHTHGRVVT